MLQKFNVTQAITKRDQSDCFAIRTEVFVEEQGVPKEEELDGLDQTSIHALARINSIPVATGRLITIDNKNARIGRMAVKIEYRRIGVASLVLYFLEEKDRSKFKNYLNGNKLSICNMFISKVHLFKNYCEILFPWLNKCFDYCVKNNLCKNENVRLPIFLAERFTSYWFSENANTKYLSFARLGKFLLSNNVNKFINPTKIPFTFRMYPTIHDY